MAGLRIFCRMLAMPLAAVIFVASFPVGAVHAGMIPTGQVIDDRSVSSDRDDVTRFLLRGDVRRQIEAFGVDPAEAAARVASLSDAEIGVIARRIGEAPAGGFFGFERNDFDNKAKLGIFAGFMLLILVIILILDALGYTDLIL